MTENLKPGDTPRIFELSVINGQPNFQEQLVVQGWDWPKRTWFEKRLDEIRKEARHD